ncbi:MAG: undecaprenyl-diphosphate phosphatase [Gammaproteobacteria bacterium]
MFTTTHLVALALLQGITEFLPISSSGHLVLLPTVTGWPDHGLVYDVAAHFGTLFAVVYYFRRDLLTLSHAWYASIAMGEKNADTRAAWGILWATLPVCVIGLLARDIIAEHLRSPLVIATTTIFFGLLLWSADYIGRRKKSLESLRIFDVAVIGFAQALALIPGTSRSGITMSAGLLLGFTREAAARFSFLLSIPVIALAALYESWHLFKSGVVIDFYGLVLVMVLSAISALVCIVVFLKFIESAGFGIFVIYRVILGAVLVAVFI